MNEDKTIDTLVNVLCDELGGSDSQKLADIVDRLRERAMNGDEDAMETLVSVGNIVTNSLFVLWAAPGRENRIITLRKIAAKKRHFPVPFHARKEENSAWKMMVKDIAVGSGLSVRFLLGRGRPAPRDVVDAIVSGLHQIEYFKDAARVSSIPDEYREVIQLELVKENAGELAKFLVRQFEMSDPAFIVLSTGGDRAFKTAGRNFSKVKNRRKETLLRQQAAEMENESIPPKMSPQKIKEWEDEKKKYSRNQISKKLDAIVPTATRLREDLTEAVTSRLKSMLKDSPVN